MNSRLLHQVALTLVPHIGPVQAKILLQHFEPEKIFTSKQTLLERIEGIGSVRAEAIRNFRDFETAEKEVAFIEQKKIRPLFLGADDYPKRLIHCYDPPTLLYLKGEIDLNAEKVIGIIGTRNHSEYGRQITEKFVRELEGRGIVVISGLAYGIDAIAHRAALKHQMPTAAVLAHGLNQVYPTEHLPIARDIIRDGGGLLTEFNTLSKPDKHNFPVRNRVVAGLCDAIVVMETGMKGGSMITADLANGYNRDVFAFPGKTTDARSTGCNFLIRKNKAGLISDAAEFLEAMGWGDDQQKKPAKQQRELFIELTQEETVILEILKKTDPVHIDEISLSSGFSSSTVAATILGLEFKGIVRSKPGKMYALL